MRRIHKIEPTRTSRRGGKELNELISQLYPDMSAKFVWSVKGEGLDGQGWWLVNEKQENIMRLGSSWEKSEKKLLQAIARKQKKEPLEIIETRESVII